MSDHHDHDLGLQADLQRLMQMSARRRHALRLLAAGGVGMALQACGGGSDETDTSSDDGTGDGSGGGSSGGSGSGTTSCSVIPSEIDGPYPGDGSNSNSSGIANALALSGIVRSDIRTSVAGASGTADGVELVLTLKLVDTNGSCASLEDYAVYLWHCDAEGRYSMYSNGITTENYLRGVQAADASGELTFTTIVPGCYSGRWPHMHFEIYRSAGEATSYRNKLRTSQLAIPEAVCDEVYALSTYATSRTNLRTITLATDTIFNDGYSLQMLEMSGDPTSGYTGTLTIGLAA